MRALKKEPADFTISKLLSIALTMAVARNFTKAQLVETRHGEMRIEDRAVLEAAAAAEALEPEREEAPTKCPYCGAKLGEDHYLSDNLLRCPNPGCERCIYLEEMSGVP